MLRRMMEEVFRREGVMAPVPVICRSAVRNPRLDVLRAALGLAPEAGAAAH